MKFRDLVSSKHICYLTVDYDMYQMSRAHFSHSTSTTEMVSSLVPENFRTLYDSFNVNEAITFMILFTFMISAHKCSIVDVKLLNTLIRQSFSS